MAAKSGMRADAAPHDADRHADLDDTQAIAAMIVNGEIVEAALARNPAQQVVAA